MDQNQESPTARDYVALAVVVGTTAFSVYHLGRLGRDWAREGIRAVKDKKNQTEK